MKTATRLMMFIAGMFLLVAGGLKVYQLLTEPMPTEPIIDTWLFAIIQVPLELGLGIWLVSGLFKKAGWLVAQIGYGVFVWVTVWRLATGQEHCGCFGTYEIAPAITLFAIDIPIFLGLAIFYPRKEKLLPPPWPNTMHFIAVAIPTAMLLSALVPTLIFNKVEAIDTDIWLGSATGNGEEKPVDPDGKNGEVVSDPEDDNTKQEPDNGGEVIEPVVPEAKKWEVLEKVDIADAISSGVNVTVLHRHDCDKCHETLPKFEEYANDLGTDADAVRISLVELPPFGESTGYVIPDDTKCLTGKYLGEKLFVSTPVIVVTLDGVVKKLWTSEDETPTFDDLLEAIMLE